MESVLIPVESSDVALVDQLATDVRDHMSAAEGAARLAVGHWIAAGSALLAARAAGEFKTVYEAAGLNKSMASRLATVADRFASEPSENLPTSWSTLYELSRVDEEVLEEAIEAGLVTPDMTKLEARALAQGASAPGVEADPDEGETTADREVVASAPRFAELRDEAVFSVERGRLADAVTIIMRPDFRLTEEVARDILKALRPLEDARSTLLAMLDDEVGNLVELPVFDPPRRVIPISDPRDQQQVAGTHAFEASQVSHSVV